MIAFSNDKTIMNNENDILRYNISLRTKLGSPRKAIQ